MRRVFVLLLILLAVYVAYPYWTLYRLERALLANDPQKLEKVVDFPSVRAHLKDRVETSMLAKSQELAESNPILGNVGEALTRALAPTVVGGTVEELVTPEAVLENPTVVEHRDKHESFRDFVRYAFFTSPTTFKVESKNPKDADAPTITSILTLRDFRWRVTKVELPSLKALVPGLD